MRTSPIRRVTIKRFRSFPAASLELDNPLFIVGRNGSGKSNLADVFSFAAEAMTSPLQAVFDRRGGIATVRNRSSVRSAPPNMRLAFEFGPINGIQGGRFAFEVRALPNYGFQIVREQCLVTMTGGGRWWFDRGDGWVSNVEGFGEVEAVPVLVRRLITEARCFEIQVGPPIRRTQSQLRNELDVKAAVEVAFLQPDCEAVLILFDEEDGCPVTRAEEVRAWARRVSRDKPCGVVVAHRECETWFLAALESLQGERGISKHAVAPAVPESKRDAKGALEAWMPPNRAYSETQDQPALSALFDLVEHTSGAARSASWSAL